MRLAISDGVEPFRRNGMALLLQICQHMPARVEHQQTKRRLSAWVSRSWIMAVLFPAP